MAAPIERTGTRELSEASPLEHQEMIVRRQRNAIVADLRQIQSDLRLDLLQERRARGEQLDSKTILILEWHERFSRVLAESVHPQQVYDTFKNLLQQILVDSIFRSALDANCLLGNDGETYTEMGLQVYRNLAPAQFQNRSPLHPESARPLETVPHVSARYMVAWLTRHNVSHRNAQNDVIENAYRQLNTVAERLPPPGMNQDEVIRQIMARQVQRHAVRETERNLRIQQRRVELEAQQRAELVPIVQRGFAEVEQRVDAVAARQLRELRELNQDVNREINVLQPAIDHLEVEIAALENQERSLEGQNALIQSELRDLQNTHRQFKAEATALKKEIKKSEKAALKNLGKALLVIGASALATLAVSCMIAAAGCGAGIGAAATPMSQGASFVVTVPF